MGETDLKSARPNKRESQMRDDGEKVVRRLVSFLAANEVVLVSEGRS